MAGLLTRIRRRCGVYGCGMQLGRILQWFGRSRRYGKFILAEFAAK